MRLLYSPAIITMLLFAACMGSGDKYFTGTVEYSYTYTSDSLNSDSLAKRRPSQSVFRYDLNNYQSRFTGKDTETYYYSGLTGKCISKSNAEENYSCEDYTAFTDSVISFRLYDTEEKILGYSCRILEIQKKNSWLKYYVSDDLVIAPATYQKHKSYNWDFYGEKAGGGLILKLEHRFKYFTMKGTATKVNKSNADFTALQLDEKLFTQICK